MKKMTIRSMMLLVAGLTAFAACTSDDTDAQKQPSTDGRVLMNFEIGAMDVRTKLLPDENNKVVFVQGDSISVFNNKNLSENDMFEAKEIGDSGAIAPVAKFNGYSNVGATYFAILYPFQNDAKAEAINGRTATIQATIPTVQKAIEGTYDPKANVAVAVTEAHEWDVPKFYLQNVVGLLKFSVPKDSTYAKIVIRSADSTMIAGKITINVSDDQPGIGSTGDEANITLVGPITGGKVYYVAMLPQNFTNGIIMDFYKGIGQLGTKKIYNGISGPILKRSKILNVGTVTPEYDPGDSYIKGDTSEDFSDNTPNYLNGDTSEDFADGGDNTTLNGDTSEDFADDGEDNTTINGNSSEGFEGDSDDKSNINGSSSEGFESGDEDSSSINGSSSEGFGQEDTLE